MSLSAECRMCGSPCVREFARRLGVPVQQNFIMPDWATARDVVRGQLAMAVCEACGFVYNRAFEPSLLAYDARYDNAQAHSGVFARHVASRVAEIVARSAAPAGLVVEIGCGQGDFLRALIDAPHAAFRGLGFDTSYTGPASDRDGRIRFVRSYYDRTTAPQHADVVVCRHVIEHVPTPLAFLRELRESLDPAQPTRVFFETPCVEWILRQQVLWDFFYEHCSLFTAASLARAFAAAGFVVARVEHVFDGQYLWLEATPGAAPAQVPLEDPAAAAETVALAIAYGAAETAVRRRWDEVLEATAAAGAVAVWGAGAKGVTFANLADADCARIDCIIDINVNKQGRFLPGTGHQIVAPAALRERGVRHAILMNPNYRDECAAIVRDLGADVSLCTL